MTDLERDGAVDANAEPIVLELDRPSPTPIELTVRLAADPAAPAYVLVPAMAMPAGFYTPLLTALAAGGVSVAVLELRGHQRRPAPPPGRRHDYGYRDLAGDLAAAVRAVRELRPQAPVLTLGHSLGGQVASAQAALSSVEGDGAVPDRMALVASGSVGWSTWDGGSYRHLVRTQAALGVTKLVGHFPGERVGFAGREAPRQMTEWAHWARTGRFVIGDPPVDVAESAPSFRRAILALTFDRDPLSPPGSSDALVAMFTHARVIREQLRLDVRRPHFDWVRQPGPVLGRLLEWAREAAVDAPQGRLQLRPLQPGDGPELRRILATPEVARWWHAPDDDFPVTDDPDVVRWTIVVDGSVAGMVQFDEELDPAYRHASIDIFLDPRLHGRGFGTETVRRTVDHLIDRRGHHRLTIDPATANRVAIRVYEKVGFRPVGVMHAYERDPDGGGWHDGLLMELVAPGPAR